MRAVAILAFAAAGLCATPIRADLTPTDALRYELLSRDGSGSFGTNPRRARAFLPRAADRISLFATSGELQLLESTRRFLRSVPGTVRRLYPAEFKPGTPDDISDLLDAYVVAAADRWKIAIETRCTALDGLLAMSLIEGHRGHPREMAKLQAIVDRTRVAIARADAAPSPTSRYGRLLAIDCMSLEEAEARGLVPSNYREESSATVRFGRRRDFASGPIVYDPLGEVPPAGVEATLVGGTLSVHGMFWSTDVQFEKQRDIHLSWDLAFVVEGANSYGPHAVTSATLGETTEIVLYHGGGSTTHRDLTLVDGTLEVTELTSEWLSGTFTLRMRTDSGAAMTVRGVEFGAWLGSP
jgi:hypothetical protein